MDEMKVVADPEEVLLVELSNTVLNGRDPYSAATQSLHDINYESFKRKFKELGSRSQLDLVSKIVERSL
jgi:hypothetical protein